MHCAQGSQYTESGRRRFVTNAPQTQGLPPGRGIFLLHGVVMALKKSMVAAGLLALVGLNAANAQAPVEIQWWHSMGGALGEWVNDLAKDFNASQKTYKVVPTFKGSYDESMTAAIAAFRAGNAPHILQGV
jgi:ABC-type glycerol-3-phosphate transport system substrate-binding protein